MAQLLKLKKSKEYFSRPQDFTRDRVFTFETVFFILVDLPRKTLSVEIAKALKNINGLLKKDPEGTKSGFCKARNKIKPSLFQAINELLVDLFYGPEKGGKQKRWRGFILRAIDGSIVDMIDTTEIREEFGVQVNQPGYTVQARMLIGYDVLNKVITHSYLGPLSVGEGTVAKTWIESMSREDLCIYDRLYPGMVLQYLHDYYQVSYVMRCKTGHNSWVKAFLKSEQKEDVQNWPLAEKAVTALRKMGFKVNSKTTIKVRMLRVELDSGEVEVLLSSLVDTNQYAHHLFKAIYGKRWGVETAIGYLKNTLQIELASGRSVKSIYQDFFATIFRANVQGLIEQDCQGQVEEISQNRLHDYQINRTAAAGNLKGELPALFLRKKPARVYRRLKRVFIKNLEPIRPQRQLPRKKRSQKLNGKYKPMKNYKRAV